MASHSENIHTICGKKKKKKSTAFGDVILMGFGSFKIKGKETGLSKQNCYLKNLVCLSA